MGNGVFFVILGAAAATYFTRFPLLVLSGRVPEWLKRLMSFIAPAVLTALIVPNIFINEGKPGISLSNIYLIAAAVTALIVYYTKNMLLSVVSGVLIVGLLNFFM